MTPRPPRPTPFPYPTLSRSPLSLAAHVEEALLLAGEGGLGQILGGRRGAYRHGQIAARAHALQLRAHRRRQGGRKGGGENPLTDPRSGGGEPRPVIDLEGGKLAADARLHSALVEELAVGVRGGGEAAGHLHAESPERADHLPERGVLAADRRHVAHRQLLEGDDVGFQERSCRSTPGACRRAPRGETLFTARTSPQGTLAP